MKAILCLLLLTAVPSAAQLRRAPPSSAGMSAERLDHAAGILASEINSGKVGAASILVARRGKIVLHSSFGKLSSAANAPATAPDSVFLLASITKAVTASALMILADRGMVSLTDPVSQYLPEFTGSGREKIRVQDILSHTSGLPDMVPENTALRRAHAPLSKFVTHTFTTPLLYVPREDFRYQSMGLLLAGEIVERLTKMSLRDFFQKEIFVPLGMNNSALGMKPGWRIQDTVWCYESPDSNRADNESFGANSPYWRDMGHPWGGMHSTTGDLAILMQTFLNGGSYNGTRVLSPAAVKAMITDHNKSINKPWGLGWGLAHSIVWMYAGDLVSPRTFGHSGATGTVAWADPERQLLCIILTNQPVSFGNGRLLRLVSNAVAASVED